MDRRALRRAGVLIPVAALLLAALLAAAPPAARAAETGPVAVRDDRGTSVAFAAPARRVVSLLPSFTEAVCALGACDRLVGTDRFSNWPASVRALPKLGGLDDAQVERIAALRPDVVLAAGAARAVGRLEALGIRVLVLDSRDHADVRRTLDVLERVLATPGAAARAWQGIERDVAAAAARVPAAQHGRRVYFEIDATPYGAGPGSFIGQTLARLGLGNALPEPLGPFPKLNPEALVRLQPDIVMAHARELEAMARRPGWSSLQALRDGQACGFPPERYELLVRPGPRMGEAALVLAECVASLPRAAAR